VLGVRHAQHVAAAELPLHRGASPLPLVDRLAGMEFEYWYVVLPTITGKRLKGENPEAHLNRELAELVERGWEPLSISTGNPHSFAGFLMRKPRE
jgi:hypothetical protein